MKRLAIVAGLLLLLLPSLALADGARPVIGGTDAPAGKWPDAAGIIFDYGGQEDMGCTGTLIAPTLVLTAGHCNDPSLVKVVIGAPARSRMAEGEVIAVSERFEFPNSWQMYDVAVVRLAEASTIEPRTIATGWARYDIVNGARAELVGFGAVDRDGNRIVDALQEATSSITDADCTTSAGCNAGARPNGELGAGGGGIDTCPGDSGGPLYLVTDYGTFLAGVTSRGYDDNQFYCSEGGIYARADAIADWVETTTGVDLPDGPGPTGALVVESGSSGSVQVDANDPNEGTTHSYTIVTQPEHGTAEISADGSLTYTPEAGYLGDDVVVVEATDEGNAQRKASGKILLEVVEESGGCGCSSGGTGTPVGAFAPLLLAALALLRRRR